MLADESARAVFRRRQRPVLLAALVLGVSALLRLPYSAQRYPELAGWSAILSLMGSLALFVAMIWAWRCTVCGAGLKMDGKTCSACGRTFR